MPVMPEPLTPAAFAPFGQVLMWPDGPPDASGNGWTWWGEVLALPAGERRWAAGLLHLTPATRQIDWAERHAHSAELVVPLDGPCDVYVMPEGQPGQPDLARLRLFTVTPGQAVVLRPGIWHGAPLAARHARVLVLLPEGTGTQDTLKVTFAAVAAGDPDTLGD